MEPAPFAFGAALFPSFFLPGMDDPFLPFHAGLLGFGRPAPAPAPPSRVVIEEIDASDDHDDEREMIKRPRPRTDSAFIPDVADFGPDRRSQQTQSMRSYSNMNGITSQAHTFSYQSSSVTYDGINGAYYTSTTRRIGCDGVIFEESKEADSTSGRASHRISRAIKDCGHSVSRKLDTGGRVDTVQTLHNLDEDELDGFERAWEVKAKKYLPGLEELNMNPHGQSSSRQNDHGRLALPSTIQRLKKERVTRRTNLEGRARGGNLKNMKSSTDRKRKSYTDREPKPSTDRKRKS